jgi:peroxiredoxin
VQAVPDAVTPSTGWAVLHLFCHAGPDGGADPAAIAAAVKEASGGDHQVVTAAILGHKADLAFMALGPDLWRLRALQTDLQRAGLRVAHSYVSLTEVSEYAAGLPDEIKEARLHPNLPPAGMRAFCFYPMSKRRAPGQNWYTLPYDERLELMHGHGRTGRTFAGRVLQVVTGSTGIDDHEWGVTLFGVHPDDLKAAVYTMRYDEASAVYAEFGPFFTGVAAPLDEVLERVGLTG